MSNSILDKLRAIEAKAAVPPPNISTPADLIPFVKVTDPSGLGLEAMNAWPHVLRVLAYWEENTRTAMNKSRQMGATWSYALRALFLVGWKPYQTVCSANYTKEQAAELIYRMKILWTTLPKEWRPEIQFSDEYASCEKTGSRVFCVATKDTSGAGDTVTELFIDEAGLISNLHVIWPALSQGAQAGSIHIVSTPRGIGQFFANLVTQSKLGIGPFKYKFLHYSEHPDRDQTTEKGRAWKKARQDELTPDDFEREYEGVFVRPGNAYFGKEVLNKVDVFIKANPVKPKLLLNGRLKLYCPIKLDKPEKYCIGADVAEGVEGGDNSAFHIMERQSGLLIGTYCALVDTTEYAEDLFKAGMMCGRCYIGVESNNHGHAVLQWLNKHLKYRKLIRENDENVAGLGKVKTKLGITTSEATKPVMLQDVKNGLWRGTIKVLDEATYDELSKYLRLAGGAYGGAPGCKDDRVMGLCITQHVRGRRFPRSW